MNPANSKGASRRVQELILLRYVEPARRRREPTVRVRAGELARELKLSNRVPQVCTAMQGQRFLKRNHLEVIQREGPPSGQSTTLAITYRLDPTACGGEDPLLALYGTVPGAVAALRRERAAFDRDFERRQRLMHQP